MNDGARALHEMWVEENRKNNMLLKRLMWIISVISWKDEFMEEFESDDECYVCCPVQFAPMMQGVIDAMNERIVLMVDYDELPDHVKDHYDSLIGEGHDE